MGIKTHFPILRPSTIQRRKELLDVLLGPDGILQLPAPELQLVGEMRRDGCDKVFQGKVFPSWGGVGHADGEYVCDELGVPEGNAVGQGRTPVGLLDRVL